MSDIKLIVQHFPLHKRNELTSYNIYVEGQAKGLADSQIIFHPVVRHGCMTTCYFDAIKSSRKIYSQPCENCGNTQNVTFYLDVGYKNFLQKHRKYILLNQPLNVEINAISKEFAFNSSLKNNLISQLGSFIGYRIFKQLSLQQTAGVNHSVVEYTKINEMLERITTPIVQKKEYYLYGFCKYYRQPEEKDKYLYILLFLHSQTNPAKVRIVTEGNGELTDHDGYTKTMIGLIGKINTLVFAVCQNSTTQYFVSNINYHYDSDAQLLTLIPIESFRDNLAREEGTILIDQNNCNLFVLGGFDNKKSEALDYISCFLNCRWEKDRQKNIFSCEIEKNHRLFQTRLSGFSGTGGANYRAPFTQSKLAFKNSSFLLYNYDRKQAEELSIKIKEKRCKFKTKFFNLGGNVKDSTVFASGRFTSKKPGVRYITYDPDSTENPIINESCNGSKVELNFTGEDYRVIEIPYSSRDKRFTSHALVFGGRPESTAPKTDTEFNNIFIINTNNIQRSLLLEEKFKFGKYISKGTDTLACLLYDPQKKWYIRANFPFQKPQKIQSSQVYAHYIVFEFQLLSGLISFQIGSTKDLSIKQGY